MRNHTTLVDYLNKILDGQEKVQAELARAREDVKTLERQDAIIYGQRMALEQLLNYDSVEPSVEYPVAGDAIEERHEKRLEGPDGLSEEEVGEARKDVYLQEAVNTARSIDAANKSSGDNPPDDS